MKKIIALALLMIFTVDSFSQKKKRNKRASNRNQNIVQTVVENQEPVKETQTLKRKVAIARFSNETAYATGYESSSQFSKDFKSYYGYPPKEAKASFEII